MAKHEAPLPLYYRVELRLRQEIESGVYAPGQRLPTEKALQERFGVSRVTVRTALRRLGEEGLISTQRGRGTFVTSQGDESRRIERHTARLHSFEEDILLQGGETIIRVLSVERVPIPQRIGKLLYVDEGTEVARVRRVGLVGGEPLWIESRYMHPDLEPVLSQLNFNDVGFTELLELETGLRIDNSRLRITAASATKDQSTSLGIKPGDPVLVNEFADYAGGRPIEAARAVFRADKYAFSVEARSSDAMLSSEVEHSYLGTDNVRSIIRQEIML